MGFPEDMGMEGNTYTDNGLRQMFNRQLELNAKMGYNVTMMTMTNFKDMTLALIDEAMEALHETPWKPWKMKQQYNPAALQAEIVDMWHFLINISIMAGLSADDVSAAFAVKNDENIGRVDSGRNVRA